MSREEINKQKQDLFRKFRDELFKRVRTMQRELYNEILDIIDRLTQNADGKLSNSVANTRKVQDVVLQVEAFQNTRLQQLGKWLIRRVRRFFGLNKEYFATMVTVEKSAENKAERLVLEGLGFNSRTGAIIKNGWFHSLTQNTGIAQTVARQVNQAIAAKVGLSEFKQSFKKSFTDSDGLGLLESHFSRFAFDLFQEVDRSTAKVYADEYRMNNAVYSGTIKDNTRPFCKARVNKVYSREEIESWKDIDFQGKPKGFYDPFVHFGGYNCRHHLAWVSDELAEKLR